MTTLSEHTGEVRAIELVELPKEIPMAYLSAAAVTPFDSLLIFGWRGIPVSLVGTKKDRVQGRRRNTRKAREKD